MVSQIIVNLLSIVHTKKMEIAYFLSYLNFWSIVSGVTQIFKRMGFGKSLDMGDYLGIILFKLIYLATYQLSICFVTQFFNFFQQLVQYLLQQILSAHCRFGTICAFFRNVAATKVSMLSTELINDVAGAKPGWDTFTVQSCIWRGCCEWCYICGAFQCNQKFWPQQNWPQNWFAFFWQLLVSVYHKHLAWGLGKLPCSF